MFYSHPDHPFQSLLCGYYIVRPMRDEMGIAGGVLHLQWLFSGTFLMMLAALWALAAFRLCQQQERIAASITQT